MRMILDDKQYDKMVKAVEKEALRKAPGWAPWFKNVEEFEDWAGDVFYDLLDAALRSIDIYLEGED